MCWQHQHKMVLQAHFMNSRFFLADNVQTRAKKRQSVYLTAQTRKFLKTTQNPALLKKNAVFSGKFQEMCLQHHFVLVLPAHGNLLALWRNLFCKQSNFQRTCLHFSFRPATNSKKKNPPIRKRLNFEEFRIFTQIGNTWKSCWNWNVFLLSNSSNTRVFSLLSW